MTPAFAQTPEGANQPFRRVAAAHLLSKRAQKLKTMKIIWIDLEYSASNWMRTRIASPELLPNHDRRLA
jgi:hypothetical protein